MKIKIPETKTVLMTNVEFGSVIQLPGSVSQPLCPEDRYYLVTRLTQDNRFQVIDLDSGGIVMLSEAQQVIEIPNAILVIE